MGRAHRQEELALGDERLHRPDVPEAAGTIVRPGAATGGRPEHVVVGRSQRIAERRAHCARVQEPDDHKTSASTKTKKASEMTPFIVKKAVSRRRRSPGRTSECS